MDNYLTIGQLGKKVGLPTKTIRFYEEIQLVTSKRAANGYRLYSPQAIEELSLIKYARSLGLPIAEIKKLIQGCKDQNCKHTKEYIDRQVDNYVQLLEKKIQELNQLKTKLTHLKEVISINSRECKNGEKYCCNILKMLEDLPEGGER